MPLAQAKLTHWLDGNTMLDPRNRLFWTLKPGIGGLCLILMLVLTTGDLAGCQSITGIRSDDGVILPPPTGPGLVAQSRSLIPDVPTPVGFVGVGSRSSSYVTADGVRNVNHVYQGRGSVADAVNFYRLHLPSHGWKRVREQSESRNTTMMFSKGRESLIIRITDRRIVDVHIGIRNLQVAQPQTQPRPQTQLQTNHPATPTRQQQATAP